mmetsp:Transcript_8640/g.13705  ORF Transcript_8640/g.13705 Transcript_8640/m.13705 type:complete len:165 (-) Transcript_8640:155-649(-)
MAFLRVLVCLTVLGLVHASKSPGSFKIHRHFHHKNYKEAKLDEHLQLHKHRPGHEKAKEHHPAQLPASIQEKHEPQRSASQLFCSRSTRQGLPPTFHLIVPYMSSSRAQARPGAAGERQSLSAPALPATSASPWPTSAAKPCWLTRKPRRLSPGIGRPAGRGST